MDEFIRVQNLPDLLHRSRAGGRAHPSSVKTEGPATVFKTVNGGGTVRHPQLPHLFAGIVFEYVRFDQVRKRGDHRVHPRRIRIGLRIDLCRRAVVERICNHSNRHLPFTVPQNCGKRNSKIALSRRSPRSVFPADCIFRAIKRGRIPERGLRPDIIIC